MSIPELLPESAPNTGSLLDGRYQLETRIGAGGMGVVYRARDEMLGRTVAVKVFREAATDAARTSSETRLLAALNHASLVTLFDAQLQAEGPGYLVMEHVDGPTLRERLDKGPIAAPDVAGMARDLAEGLHVVHDAGIVHRDIKPSNVLLLPSHLPGEEFRAKLADFGIAYLIDSTRLTTPGTLLGTAAYLSPEQVRGAEPAPASDIYALGLVLVEALTGERAFAQSTGHEAALARLTSDPSIPGTFGYGWKALLTSMTARDPQQRPTALEVVIAAAKLGAPDSEEITEITGRIDVTGRIEATKTMVLPDEAETVALDAPDDSVRESPRAARRLRRWHIVVAVVALAAVAVIVGILVLGLGASSPAEAPALPALNGPLGTHMQQLLDSVTP